ncbi:MAG: hypothetical protein Q8918_09385 [Bacteroidota bacterium]|nr:hypothetical protein [Bacteroidota bacterium]MDP4250303.1 hypothetical protein [Bacteroidota bacterium]
MNPKLITGTGCSDAGKDGAVYLFSNVGMGIDALVKIQGRSSSQVTLSEIDLKGPDQDSVRGTGYDNAWQPRVCYGNGDAPAHSSWWMEFKISFISHDHPDQAVSVNQFFVSGLDIDGDGQNLHEYQSYYQVHDFSMMRNTAMTFLPVKGCLADPAEEGRRFDGTTEDYAGVTTNADETTVDNFYRNTSRLIVRVGAETGNRGSHAADRMYALWFKSLIYDVPVNAPQPLTLVAFNAQLENDRNVKLNWSTAMEQHTSHFILERSLDGNEYDDHAVIFTDENRAVRKDYQFTDHLTGVAGNLVYYRLKMVDRESKYSYSDVIAVKTHRDRQMMVSVNPVVKESEFAIPVSMQNKMMYSICSINAKMHKKEF